MGMLVYRIHTLPGEQRGWPQRPCRTWQRCANL